LACVWLFWDRCSVPVLWLFWERRTIHCTLWDGFYILRLYIFRMKVIGNEGNVEGNSTVCFVYSGCKYRVTAQVFHAQLVCLRGLLNYRVPPGANTECAVTGTSPFWVGVKLGTRAEGFPSMVCDFNRTPSSIWWDEQKSFKLQKLQMIL